MQRRAQPISLLLLFLALLAHAAAILMQILGPPPRPYPGFPEIFVFFAVLSTVCSLFMFLSPSLITFRLLLVLKILCMAALAKGLGPRFPEVLPMLLPSMLEIALYERPGVATVFLAALPVLSCILQTADSLPLSTPSRILPALILTAAVTAAASVMAVLLSIYRASLTRLSAEKEKLEKAVSELSDMNLNYQALALSAREASMRDERHRLTRELHDALGYALTNIAMMMEAGAVTLDSEPTKAKEILGLTRRQALDGLTEVRTVLYALRDPGDSAPRGLRAVHRLISVFKAASQADVRADFGNAPNEWDGETDAAVFHFVREALMNAIKHGHADRIRVTFQDHEGTLHVAVSDNGPGAAVVREGLGMTGMRERLGPLGGTLSYRTDATGFEIRAALPLKE